MAVYCQLKNDYGVNIDLKDGKVYIWGVKSRVDPARYALLAVTSYYEQKKTADAVYSL